MANFGISIGMSEQASVAGRTRRQHCFFSISADELSDLNFIMSIRQRAWLIVQPQISFSLSPSVPTRRSIFARSENCNFAWFMWRSISTLITATRKTMDQDVLQLSKNFTQRAFPIVLPSNAQDVFSSFAGFLIALSRHQQYFCISFVSCCVWKAPCYPVPMRLQWLSLSH